MGLRLWIIDYGDRPAGARERQRVKTVGVRG
jgi:hypothetical protein